MPRARQQGWKNVWPMRPRSRGLNEHRVFSCGEGCIPALSARVEIPIGGGFWSKKSQQGVTARESAWRCEHEGYNITVFKRTLLSVLRFQLRKFASSDAKFAWFNLTP